MPISRGLHRPSEKIVCSWSVLSGVMRVNELEVQIMLLPIAQPVPLVEMAPGFRLTPIGVAGAGFPSPAQDWEEDAINLVELLRLNRAASFVFQIDGTSTGSLHESKFYVRQARTDSEGAEEGKGGF
jgi:hypothetical protein